VQSVGQLSGDDVQVTQEIGDENTPGEADIRPIQILKQ
jgi:hypothetical protein